MQSYVRKPVMQMVLEHPNAVDRWNGLLNVIGHSVDRSMQQYTSRKGERSVEL